MGVLRRRGDLIDEHIDVTERVRKLEIMQQSLTLTPKPWQPYNPTLDIAVAHAIRACGLHNMGGTLDPRMPPEADWIFRQVATGASAPDSDLLWRMWLQCGVGPQYWVQNLQRIGEGGAVYGFFTGDSDEFTRHWTVFGPPLNYPQLDGEGAYVYLGDDTGIPDGGSGTLPPYAGYPLIDDSGPALPEGGYYNGNQITVDLRTYQTVGMPVPLPCQDLPYQDPFAVGGDPHELTIPVSRAGCPNNPLHPQFSSGELRGRYYTSSLRMVSPHPQLSAAVDLLTSAQAADLSGNHMGHRSVSIDLLRQRISMCFASPAYAGIKSWYEAMIGAAQAELRTALRAGWQTLPLYPGWWGRVESCKFTERFVTFRGRARCGSATPQSAIFAAYPNHLPIGSRGYGSIMPGHMADGQEVQIKLGHEFRSGDPEDYLQGEGSVLELYRPFNFSDLEPTGDPPGHEFVLDGCQFPIFEGPFDEYRV